MPISAPMHGTYTPEVWAKLLIAEFHPRLFLNYITNNDYEGEIRDKGDVVKIRSVPKVTIGDYTARTNLAIQDLTPDAAIELAIDKGKYYAINAEDIEVHQADVDYVNKAIEEAAIGIKEGIESDVLNAVYAFVAAENAGATAGKKSGAYNLGKEGAAVQLTKDNVVDFLVDCGSVLDEQNVPETDRFFVLPPVVANRIKKSDIRETYITGDKLSSLRTGNIGMIDRFNIFVSNMFDVGEDGFWRPIFGQKSAITFATQLVKNEVVTREARFGKVHRGLSVYGYEVVKPEALGYALVSA